MLVFILKVIVLTLGLFIPILIIKDLVYEDRNKRINKLIPGPSGIPVFGNLLQINASDFPTSLDSLYKKYGSIFRLRLGNVETVVVTGGDNIDQIYSKNRLAQHRYIRFSRYFLKDKDIMYSNGDYHYQLRNTIMSEITVTKLNNNRLDVNNNVIKLIEKINNKFKDNNSSQIIEDFPFLVREASIKLLIKFIYGTEESEETNKRFIEIVKRLFKSAGQFIYSDYAPFLLPIDIVNMSKSNMVSDYLYLRDYSNKIIKGYEENKLNQKDQINNSEDSNRPIIEQYYDKYLNGEINYESISYACVDLLVAGLDSTSNTLAFTFIAIVNQPEIQDKLYKEIINNNTKNNLSFADLSKYPYTKSVMDESYRYYSVVPFAEPNIVVEDIECNGYKISKGTQLIKNIRSTHLSSEYWGRDSQSFNPDRYFDSSNKNKLYHFGIGARACIGRKFAECVFFITLVLLTKHFKFVNPTSTPIDDTGIVALAMQCKEYNLKVVKRE